jgi:uncharacterized membrane protein YqjE
MSTTEPAASERSLGELFSQLTTDLGGLVRDEIALAKVELKEDAQQAGKAASMLGAAAFAGYMTVVVLSFAAAWALAELMAVGWAFLIVGVVWGIAGTLLYLRGRDRMTRVNLKPEQTVETLKEDVQWAKNQKS